MKVGVLVTADHPWLGVGQDIFPQVAQKTANARLSAHEAALLRPYLSESPHNALLSITSSAGIPALAAYLAAVLGVAARMLTARRAGRHLPVTVLAVMTGYLVSSLFMTPEVSTSTTFWVVLGAACSSIGAAPREAAQPPSSEPIGVERVT
jgi:O-antigen ligase